MELKTNESERLRKRLYAVKEKQSGLSIFLFWNLNKNLLYIMRELRQIKQSASEEKNILDECTSLEASIRDSFVYNLKGKEIDGVLEIESQGSLEDRLNEISLHANETINTKEKLRLSYEYLKQSTFLVYAYKADKNKEIVKETKDLMHKLKQGIEYWKFLVKANSELDKILDSCFTMNRKTDFYVENTMSHYFRMRRLGGYSKIISRDLLKYYDQRENSDLCERVALKNKCLNDVTTKINSKVQSIKVLLDEELLDIEGYFEDNRIIYPSWLLKEQKSRLSRLELKYKALGLDYPATKSSNIKLRIDYRLRCIREGNKNNKRLPEKPSNNTFYLSGD